MENESNAACVVMSASAKAGNVEDARERAARTTLWSCGIGARFVAVKRAPDGRRSRMTIKRAAHF